jgi:hypothetical protein
MIIGRRNSLSKKSTSRGVCRCSIAWGVTAAPHCTAICANFSSDAFGVCRYPNTYVRANEIAANFRFR